jgi:signal transduction histidine kinase
MVHMPARTPLSLLRRVPPGVWTAVIWCAYTADSVRMYSGLPGMPRASHGLKPATGLVLALATAAAIAGCFLLRRRALPAIGLLIAGSVAAALAHGSPTIALAHYVAVDVALGFIVATRPRLISFAALALTIAVLPGYARARMALGTPPYNGPPGWEVYALTAVVAWLAGDSVRRARQYAERLRAHAAAEAVAAERLRISRELHDLVAHSIGIIALQAGAAARVIDTQPQRAREALYEVENAGRETLAGLRRMLGPLRQLEQGQLEHGQPQPDQPERRQAHPDLPGSMPGLADVDRLAAATTAAGVRVDVQWQGERCPLPPDIDLAAYRIVQESVTNVVRHAGTPSCRVRISRDDEALSIEVADDGPGRGGEPGGVTSGTGYGLAGMRERAALLHGDFTAGPGPAGGFVVTARLPVPAEPAPAWAAPA